VSEIVWTDQEDDGMRSGNGFTVCGLGGFLTMPGILGRLGAPRCKHCCRILSIPDGDGAPFNTDEEWQYA
jgi:hypothetical protein